MRKCSQKMVCGWKKIAPLLLSGAAGALILPSMALAAPCGSIPTGGSSSIPIYWCDADDVVNFITRVLDYLFVVFLVVAVIMFVFAGFAYVTAGGEEEKLKKAKSRLTWGIVGVAVALLSTSIRFVIESLL